MVPTTARRNSLITILVLVFAALLKQQAISQTTVGIQPFGSYASGVDQISLADLGVHIDIPLFSHRARGQGDGVSVHLIYDSGYTDGAGSNYPVVNVGWRIVASATSPGNVNVATLSTHSCTGQYSGDDYGTYSLYGFSFTDATGYTHPFAGYSLANNCLDGGSGPASSDLTEPASDGSGYILSTSGQYGTVTAPSGTVYSGLTTDSNGNVGLGSRNFLGGSSTLTDTSGVSVQVSGGDYAPAGGPWTSRNPAYIEYADSSGNSKTITIAYRMYEIAVWPFTAATEDISGLVDSVTFPDGSSYHFGYQPSQFLSGASSGILGSVELPTSGTISYQNTWSTTCGNPPTALTRTTSDGATSYAITINSTQSGSTCVAATSTTAISKPDGSSEAVHFVTSELSYSGGTGGVAYSDLNLETSHSWSTSSGTLLRSTMKCYNGASGNCATTAIVQPITQIATTTTLNDVSPAQSSKVVQTFNAASLPTEVDEYDFGATAPTRKTVTTYASLGNNIKNRPSSVIQEDNSGFVFKKTTYGYDEYSLASSGITGLAAVSGPRGNLTSEHDWWDGTDSLDSHWCYDDAGQIVASQDPAASAHGQSCTSGQITTYTHDATDTYVTGTAYPTPSSGVALSTSATYDTNTGLIKTAVDANSNTTNYLSYTSMLLPYQIGHPDGGTTTYQYVNTMKWDVQNTQSNANSQAYSQTTSTLDGYGRTIRTSVKNGQAGTNPYYQRDTCYDVMGRVSFQSYSYLGNATGSEVCSGNGDTYSYDALGRIVKILHADSTSVNYTYTGRATKITDENLVKRISQVDGLGRVTGVCEISNSTTMPNSGSPVSCGMDIPGNGFLTGYAYDIDHNKVTVTQGAQTRSFSTDSVGRPTVVTEPETGTTNYGYSYSTTSGLGLTVTRKRPKANQINPSSTTLTTTQYDVLGRVVSVSYTDGTPTKTLSYDQATAWGSSSVSLGSSKGRLTQVYTTTSIHPTFGFFAYDSMGRVTRMDQCLPSTGCDGGAYEPSLLYTYDWLGDLITSTDAAGTTTTYTYSSGGEVQSIVSSLSGATNPAYLVSKVVNGPNGPVSYTLGNGLTKYRRYDTLGRLNGEWLCSGISIATPSCTGGQEVYGFTTIAQGSQLLQLADTVQNQTDTYSYDEFNRLSGLNVTGGTVQNFTYTYDRYGNRWDQNLTQGSSGPQPQLSFTAANNQLPASSGYTYDAAGNMTYDLTHHYTYDAEGNITAVDGGSTAKYTYNALNQRVRIDVGSAAYEFRFHPNGQRAGVWDGHSYAALRGQFYWGAMPVAYYTSAATHFQHQDYLGTARMQTGYNGSVEATYTSLPFGDGSSDATGGGSASAYGGGAADDDAYHFASVDHDYETNTEHAQFRNYSPAMGRWMSPDPYAGSYDITNPQSMNRYSYGLNDPLVNTDPTGMDCVKDNGDGTVSANAGDCANENEDAANHEYYLNCDGCTSGAAGANLDNATGSLYLTDSSGGGIAGTTVQGFADPQGTPATNVTVDASGAGSVIATGYGINGIQITEFTNLPRMSGLVVSNPYGSLGPPRSVWGQFKALYNCYNMGDPDNKVQSGRSPTPSSDSVPNNAANLSVTSRAGNQMSPNVGNPGAAEGMSTKADGAAMISDLAHCVSGR